MLRYEISSVSASACKAKANLARLVLSRRRRRWGRRELSEGLLQSRVKNGEAREARVHGDVVTCRQEKQRVRRTNAANATGRFCLVRLAVFDRAERPISHAAFDAIKPGPLKCSSTLSCTSYKDKIQPAVISPDEIAKQL